MDLDKLTANTIETVFGLLPTTIGIGTYYSSSKNQSPEDYDPVQDLPTTQPVGVPNVRMLRVSNVNQLLPGTIVTVDDVKIIIPAKDLPGVIPGTQDWLDYPGVRYDVVKVHPLPTVAVHILYCRAK